MSNGIENSSSTLNTRAKSFDDKNDVNASVYRRRKIGVKNVCQS
jgi:hypothetical protein